MWGSSYFLINTNYKLVRSSSSISSAQGDKIPNVRTKFWLNASFSIFTIADDSLRVSPSTREKIQMQELPNSLNDAFRSTASDLSANFCLGRIATRRRLIPDLWCLGKSSLASTQLASAVQRGTYWREAYCRLFLDEMICRIPRSNWPRDVLCFRWN